MSMMMFVDDWQFGGVLGEGAFGEVKLLINTNSGVKIAVKMIDLVKHKDEESMVKKEICIHKILNNENVLKFYGSRQEDNVLMMFLEYAIGGELFDKIEPDVGMPAGQAQHYMKQLLNGIQYLHQKGVAHRDIKPENLLINEHDVLKICDFGLATMFKLKGKERLLDKRCGTLPYVAPEVISGSAYHAEPADIWSCGVVFICMMCGEAPFHMASTECPFYVKWTTGNYILITPWTKLQYSALNLVKKILIPNPKKRLTIPQIMEHSWMSTKFDYNVGGDTFSEESSIKNSNDDNVDSYHNFSYSQPIPCVPSLQLQDVINLIKKKNTNGVCFSQPTHNEDLVVNSQLPLTQTQTIDMNTFQCMVKRMTRFFVKGNIEDVIKILGTTLDKFCYVWNMDVSGVITASTVDKRKMSLVFKISLLEMDSKLLADFRLSKGCGLEFKRRFIKLKHNLKEIIQKEVVP